MNSNNLAAYLLFGFLLASLHSLSSQSISEIHDLIEVAKPMEGQDTYAAIELYRGAWDKAIKIGNDSLSIFIANRISVNYFNVSDYAKLIRHVDSIAFPKIEAKTSIKYFLHSQVYQSLAHKNMNQYKEAIESIEYFETLRTRYDFAKDVFPYSEQLLADVYAAQGKYKSAIKNGRQAYDIAIKNQSKMALASASYGLFQANLALNEFREASMYYDAFGKYMNWENQSPEFVAKHVSSLLGSNEIINLDKLEELFETYRQSDRTFRYAYYLALHIGDNYLDELNFEKAKTYYKEAEKSPVDLAQINQKFYNFYLNTNQLDSAKIRLDKYINLKEKSIQASSDKSIEEYEVKYETQKKEARLKQKTFNNYLLILGIISLGLLAMFLLSRIKHKNQIQKQKIESLKRERKLLAIDAMLNGQQEERKRIAQDLHDGIGSLLTSARLQIKRVQEEIDKLGDFELVSATEKLIENASVEVRRIAHNMMPGALVKLGFIAAIEDLAHTAEQTDEIEVNTFFSKSDLGLSDKQSLAMYRIIQEALNNSLKYAKATNFNIQCILDANSYVFTIEDNGIGFRNDRSKGKGIDNIKSRVAYLEGELEIVSDKKGVSYHIKIPRKL